MAQLIIIIEEIIALMDPWVLLALSLSTCLGIVVGVLPGLTATMGLALLTGLTFNLDTHIAIPVLMGMYVGAMYGGSITGILINIPGHGAAAASVLDGYPLAQRGEALPALWLTRIGSVIGTLFGMLCLAFFSPLLSRVAENFSSPEYFLLGLFGIVVCGSLSSPDKPIKGWIAGMLGMMVAFVGIEEIYGFRRFTFDNPRLVGGIPLIPAMIGLFGIPQIITTLRGDGKYSAIDLNKNKNTFRIIREQLRKNIYNILRSGALGVGVGTIPGAGEDISAWMAYDRAKKGSKTPEQFGKGSYEGVIAAETANSSAIGGNIIPLLNLAVPGSAPTAVLLGALMLHNIRPGPALMLHNPRFVFTMTAILFLAAIALFIFGVLLSSAMVKILKIPSALLLPIVGVLCVIGAYAISINTFDITIMLIFGIAGYFLSGMGYPPAPMILGIILGGMVDTNMRRMLLRFDGNPLEMLTMPICIVFIVLILFSILSQFPFWKKMTQRLRKKQ